MLLLFLDRISQEVEQDRETVRVWFCNKRQKEAGLLRKQHEKTGSKIQEEATRPL